MTKGDLELFVRRLFGDESFKGLALRNLDQALSEYRLSRSEDVAARQLCARMATPQGLSLAQPFYWWF